MLHLHLELMLRVALGTLLGGVIGYERDLHGRPAGLRTHTIVALASATFMVVSTKFVYFQHYTPGDLVAVDPSRIAASVVSGIGFLGAGAIMRTGISVKGLTTAAGLWLVAAIGMAAGGGMYVESVFVTVVGLASLTMLRRFEDRGEQTIRRRMSLEVDEALSPVLAVLATLKTRGAVVIQEDYERHITDGRTSISFELRTPVALPIEEIVQALEGHKGVRRVKLDRV